MPGNFIKVRCSAEQLAWWAEAAKRSELSFSEWVRGTLAAAAPGMPEPVVEESDDDRMKVRINILPKKKKKKTGGTREPRVEKKAGCAEPTAPGLYCSACQKKH